MQTTTGARGYHKTCGRCFGKGYYEVASTILEDENETVECEDCDGSGEVELEADEIFGL
jgi:DnaJ-class molecular chaperone